VLVTYFLLERIGKQESREKKQDTRIKIKETRNKKQVKFVSNLKYYFFVNFARLKTSKQFVSAIFY
jgi:hypothetical protein